TRRTAARCRPCRAAPRRESARPTPTRQERRIVETPGVWSWMRALDRDAGRCPLTHHSLTTGCPTAGVAPAMRRRSSGLPAHPVTRTVPPEPDVLEFGVQGVDGVGELPAFEGIVDGVGPALLLEGFEDLLLFRR